MDQPPGSGASDLSIGAIKDKDTHSESSFIRVHGVNSMAQFLLLFY